MNILRTKKVPKLAIVGPYPPPVGGVSMHIQRMRHHLENNRIPYIIFNHYHYNNEDENIIAINKSKGWYLNFLFSNKYKVVHFHQSNLFLYPYYFLFSRIQSSRVIYTIHNEKLLEMPLWKRKWILRFLKHTKYYKLICVSKKISDFLRENNIENTHLPAYIPPVSRSPVKLELPENKIPFLFSVWKANKNMLEEIYNLPLVLKLLQKHKEKFFLVIMIGDENESNKDYLNRLLQEYELSSDNVLVLYNLPLADYFGNFSFFIRPTFTDGFSLSIQEALDAGLPTIASDVCQRPEGTVLFKSNDLNDLEKAVFKVLESKKINYHRKNPGFHLQLIDIYKSALNLK